MQIQNVGVIFAYDKGIRLENLKTGGLDSLGRFLSISGVTDS